MKYFIFFSLVLISCSKNSGNTHSLISNLSIAGSWNVVQDSTYQGVGLTNHLVVYKGKEGDYFDFKDDGKVYTKEGSNYAVLDYRATADSIIINSFPNPCSFNFTGNTLSIISSEYTTPGGMMKRSVFLSR